MNCSFFLCLAACRMRSSACDTLARFCARHVVCWSTFPLAPALRSISSAADSSALFTDFSATTTKSDFQRPCVIGYGTDGAKGRGQGKRGPAKHAPDTEPGKRVTGAGTCTASSKAKEEGKVHRAAPPRQCRSAPARVLRAEAECRTRRRRADVAGLRGRPRAQARGSARTGPTGSVSGAAIAATVHTEAGWPTAPARDRRAGRQDRPAGDGRGAERDLRGRFPRVLVRVPTEARTARCAGRACRRDHQHEGELDTRRRHPDRSSTRSARIG